MVAMQVRQKNAVDRIVGDVQAFKRNQARGAKVDSKANAGGIDQDTGVEPSPGTKSVARPYKSDARRHDARFLCRDAACERSPALGSTGEHLALRLCAYPIGDEVSAPLLMPFASRDPIRQHAPWAETLSTLAHWCALLI